MIVRLLLILMGLCFVTSCGYKRKSDAFSGIANVEPHFSSIYSQIIEPKCLSCHDESGGEEEESMVDYAGVLEYVRAGDPENSELYKVVISGEMPVLQPMLTDDEILAIYLWIKNGAAND